jgi:glycosyltransferase involved in cell wall biosynthesis
VFRFNRRNSASERRTVLCQKPRPLRTRKLGFGASDQETYLDLLKAKLAGGLADKVTFHGFLSRPELVEYYYNADVFAFPPIWKEGFRYIPVEAMAVGTPVVVTRSGGIVETVRDHETEFLVEKNDCRALAEAILKLLEDDALRERMGRAGRKRALERFNWDRIVAAMQDRYQGLCRADSTTNIPGFTRETFASVPRM